MRKTNGGRKKLRLIKERGPKCARCLTPYGDPDSYTVDHIIPSFMGLKNSHYRKDTNLQLLCYPCQWIKSALEQWHRDKYGIDKGSYVLLMNGCSTPLEAQIEFISNVTPN